MKAVQSQVSLVLTPMSPGTLSGFIPIFSMTIEQAATEDLYWISCHPFYENI